MSVKDDLRGLVRRWEADIPDDPERGSEPAVVTLAECSIDLGHAINKIPEEQVEYAIQATTGLFRMPGYDEDRARGMMRSTSVVIGPMKGRRLVKRTVIETPWEDA